MDDDFTTHYTSEHSLYFHEVASGGAWVDEDPQACGCRGSGWFLSEVDTFHECRLHPPVGPHPLDEPQEEVEGLLDLLPAPAPLPEDPDDLLF